MKTHVLVATPVDTVASVIMQMGTNKVSGLCVVDDVEQRHIIGVVTEFDLLLAFKENRADDLVEQIMSSTVITVTPQATLDELIDLFLAKRIRRVFVAEDGVLRGVVSRRDLLFAAQGRKQVDDFRAIST